MKTKRKEQDEQDAIVGVGIGIIVDCFVCLWML
jgi:hypothetical protein